MLCALFSANMKIRSFQDQLGNQIVLLAPPQRIISLVPSLTELLFDLGLDKQVVGITKYCVHPSHWLKEKTIVGGTKNFQVEVIRQLNPDLIIANKEENYKEGIDTLREHYPVWISDIETFDDAIQMIRKVGEITSANGKADEIVGHISGAFNKLKLKPRKKVLYLIWRKPWMGAGTNTFIHSVLERLGFINGLHYRSRYPQLSEAEIQSINPDLIMLSSEPYPFKTKHFNEIRKIAPSSDIKLVDGEMFSWYGSRLAKAPAYFNSIEM